MNDWNSIVTAKYESRFWVNDTINKVVNQKVICERGFYASRSHEDTLLIWFFFVYGVIWQSALNIHQRKNNFVDRSFFVVTHLID